MPQTSPHVTRLADYRPPAFLVDTVDLAFDLDQAATHVRSRLAVRRNPQGEARAPLLLDGEALTLVRIALDGVELGANRYRIDDGKLRLRIERTYPLSEAAAAHRDLESRRTAGKLLLIPQ